MKAATQSVDHAYLLAHCESSELLDTLRDLLHDMPTPEDATLHWGHVGTLNEVNNRLGELVQLLESAI